MYVYWKHIHIALDVYIPVKIQTFQVTRGTLCLRVHNLVKIQTSGDKHTLWETNELIINRFQ